MLARRSEGFALYFPDGVDVARALIAVAVALTGGCASVPPPAASAPIPPVASQNAPAPAAPVPPPSAPTPAPPTAAAVAPAPAIPPALQRPAAVATAPAAPASEPARPQSPASPTASVPAKPPAKAPASLPAAVAPPPANKDAAPAPAAAAAAPALDLKSLEARLRETKAIGVLTKLTLKNQVDELLDQFRLYYQGKLKTSLAELRRAYELLVLKVIALLQDADPPLAKSIAMSRESIWGILADPVKFSAV
ncbi:MAG: hypothetical protein ABI537_10470 [Casimicrobiaceae bacterium]